MSMENENRNEVNEGGGEEMDRTGEGIRKAFPRRKPEEREYAQIKRIDPD